MVDCLEIDIDDDDGFVVLRDNCCQLYLQVNPGHGLASCLMKKSYDEMMMGRDD
ncbi:hypothetical protein KIN20_016627 [Parelaphostrongylus tenuis]|uniref:Uncharacterized protein n=1 Tax=Parelaphostrongylus tenuis TaxID=148309 RepID=A0AAD5N1K2_PARTN|nr:hypothetical protein KIN20_016627 [Parelaphostrongylus tenuis]